MSSIKGLEQFFDPDPASLSMGPPLEKQYELMEEYFRLHEGVPESVRGYFDSVVTLWLYGYLYYPFYALVSFLSATAVEMALRERLPKAGRDTRGLANLLQIAKKRGLLTDAGFPSLKHRLEDTAAILGHEVPKTSYVDILIESLPKIRNNFAHPRMRTILPPGMVVDSLILASEIINQLWPKPL